jgi:signal transduction histidine kinase
MSRTGRFLVVSAAWALPATWIAVALLSGPADGTAIAPNPTDVDRRWGQGVEVVRVYGDTPLTEGNTVLQIDGRTVGDWLTDGGPGDRSVGDTVHYRIRRTGPAGVDQVIGVDVQLTRAPVVAAVRANLATVSLAPLLLVFASVAFWRRPGSAAACAFLAAGALMPAVLTSWPLGLGAIDLAGSRGIWPQAVGETAFAAGLGALLVAGLALGTPPGLLRRRRWIVPAVVALPFVGYAGWALFAAGRSDSQPERLQALATVALPALAVALPALLVILVATYVRAPQREDRLAIRLVFLSLLGGLATWLLLVYLPARLGGGALVPWGILGPPLVAAMLTSGVVAVLRYRLEEIEPTVRRALVQALLATLVGTAFVAVAGAVNVASDVSFEAMVAGGVVALLLLPVAVGLQRAIRRLVYGDRAFPGRVVSELRRLDPLTAPEEALEETLRLLARRLQLSFASIEVFGDVTDPFEVSIGERRGRTTDIDLVAGGANLGRLQLQVGAGRDPFGPGDRRLLADVGTQVGALVQAVTINRELQRSRQRIISAREEERRRVRRDLHDGLGPSLATLAMGLESAKDLLDEDPAKAAALLGQLSDQTRAEITEVRRLVDGLRPPALDQLGLVTALRQRADQHNMVAAENAMTWTVEADDDVEPLPAAVEVAAYRIVVEAVANATRHSSARTCDVTLRREGDTLLVEVRDDGVGIAPDPVPGVGLGSMSARAEELGGTCMISPIPDGGTAVTVRLPLTHESTR